MIEPVDLLAAFESGAAWPPLAGLLAGLAFDRALRVPLIACAVVVGAVGTAAWLALEPEDWAILGEAYSTVSDRLAESGFLSGMLAGKVLVPLLGGLREARR